MKMPSKGDYAPYYQGYIEKIGETDIISFLESQLNTAEKFFRSISESKADFAYASGKWTVKQLLCHVTDVERVMAYRALSIARGEKQSLPGFDENEYVAEFDASSRSLNSLTDEFVLLRKANIELFKSFSDEILDKRGTANNSNVTVLAILFITAGHVLHHINILKERYGI